MAFSQQVKLNMKTPSQIKRDTKTKVMKNKVEEKRNMAYSKHVISEVNKSLSANQEHLDKTYKTPTAGKRAQMRKYGAK